MYFLKTSNTTNQFDILKNEISNNNTIEQSSSINHTTNSFDISNNEMSISKPSIINQLEQIPIVLIDSFYHLNIDNTYVLSNTYSYSYNHYQSSLFSSYSSISSSIPTFINDVLNYSISEDNENLYIARIIEHSDADISSNIHANFALFYINRNLIKIPNKIYRTLSRYTPKHLLRDIHIDTEVAIEMCLILTTQLTSTYFGIKDGTNPDGWKSLHASYLRDLLSLNPQTYKKVITALCYPLSNGPILECDGQYIIGEKNLFYRLGERYMGKGIQSYEVQTKHAQNVLNRHYFNSLSNSIHNTICQNLIQAYSSVVLPTEKQILQEAKRLIGLGYTKKGKKLCFLNKHSRFYFKDADKRIFVEDAMEIFKYLTDNGLMIPIVGGEVSGGRVVDSFTLMPSWIRNMVKIDKQRGMECDFTCLHPNQAMTLYGGKSEYLTHSKLDLALGLEDGQAKTEHLSFFNKEVWQMKQSPLFQYYQQHEPQMLENLIQEKYKSQYKHKITSRRLFKMEVDIMTQAIQQLNSEGIYVLYVYDALYSHPKTAERVLEVMEQTALKHGVKTLVKRPTHRKQNPMVSRLKEKEFDISKNKISTTKH